MKTIMILCFLFCMIMMLEDVSSVGIEQSDINSVLYNNDYDAREDNPDFGLSKIFSFLSNKDGLKLQYGFLIPILTYLSKIDSKFNPFKLLAFVPYVILGLSVVNSLLNGGMNQLPSFNLGGLNLASLLQNPQNLTNLFSKQDFSEFANDSMRVLAGDKASGIIDKVIEDIKTNAVESKDGVLGIAGERLNALLRNSTHLKSLFPSEELFTVALNYLNAYMNLLVNPDMTNTGNNNTTDFKREFNAKSKIKREETEIRGTLSDSAAAFFSVGQTTINAIAGDGKQMYSFKRSIDPNNSATEITKLILQKVPSSLNKIAEMEVLDMAKLLKQNSFYIPNLITYFLPFKIGIETFKFMCLVTYVMILAQKEKTDSNSGSGAIGVQGLNIEKVIDTLNNKDIMTNLFPNKDVTSYALSILKFLAGPDAEVLNKLTDELKKIPTGTDENGNSKTLTIFDVLMNIPHFKKLYQIKEYADKTMKYYLGVNIEEFKNEVQNEVQNIQNNEVDAPNDMASYVHDTIAATFKVGSKKTNEALKKNFSLGGTREESNETTPGPHRELKENKKIMRSSTKTKITDSTPASSSQNDLPRTESKRIKKKKSSDTTTKKKKVNNSLPQNSKTKEKQSVTRNSNDKSSSQNEKIVKRKRSSDTTTKKKKVDGTVNN